MWLCVSEATLCAPTARMCLGLDAAGQRQAPSAIFMSPEVACNRFYFVIVLVALPFVFFMCRPLAASFGLVLFFFFCAHSWLLLSSNGFIFVVAHFWGK